MTFDRDAHSLPNKPSSNRSFGLIFAAFFLIIALLPLLHGQSLRFWSMAVSLVFGGTALAAPNILTHLNRLWTSFGLLLHSIVSPVVLAILFYGVVTPTGLLLRLVNKDPLRLRSNYKIASYWIERVPHGPDAESFKNQF